MSGESYSLVSSLLSLFSILRSYCSVSARISFSKPQFQTRKLCSTSRVVLQLTQP